MATRTVTRQQAYRLRLRDQGICVYCRNEVGAVFDHVLPWSHGGLTIDENLVLACVDCNAKKSDDLNESLIAHAFKHLLDVGASLRWVDVMLGASFVPSIDDSCVITVGAGLVLPAPTVRRQTCVPGVRCAPSILTEEKRLRKRRHRYAHQLRTLTQQIELLTLDIHKSEETTKLKIISNFEETPLDALGLDLAGLQLG